MMCRSSLHRNRSTGLSKSYHKVETLFLGDHSSSDSHLRYKIMNETQPNFLVSTEVERRLQRMRVTSYGHSFPVTLQSGKTTSSYRLVDEATGEYHYDCCGFVFHVLKVAAPRAYSTLETALGVGPGFCPSNAMYLSFIGGSLLEQPAPEGWHPVTKVRDLSPGDVLAWDKHIVIVMRPPFPMSDRKGSYLLTIADSTSSPHKNDSRELDTRCKGGTGMGTGLIVVREEEAKEEGSGGGVLMVQWSATKQTEHAALAARTTC